MSTRRARSLKYGVIIAFIVAAGLGLTASTQDWFGFTLVATSQQAAAVMVQGSDAAPGLTALSLAGIALAGALAMAGRFARLMLGILGAVLGVCILWSSASPLADPVSSGIAAITKQTGVAGDTAVRQLVASTQVAFWPVVGIVSGALFIAASVAVMVTFMAWPSASRRYDPVRFADADGGAAAFAGSAPTGEEPAPDGSVGPSEAPHSAEVPETAEPEVLPDEAGARARDAAIDSWDELSRGDDPTA